MVSIIGGIPGVGKTTVLDMTGLKVVNFGTVMLELSGMSDRDKMRGLPVEKQRDLQRAAASRIGSMGNVLVDTHYSIKTQKGYLPGIPPWVSELLEIENIIIIESDEISIFERRIKDTGRERKTSLEEIREHQAVNRGFATALAQLKGAVLSILVNEEGKAGECARVVREIMEV
jgi:adenylate kinase